MLSQQAATPQWALCLVQDPKEYVLVSLSRSASGNLL
jgi:hypothetical protein